MIRSLVLSVLVLGSSFALAQAVGGGVSGYSNPKSLKGLCTADNREEFYFKEGTCQSLKEQLTADQCTADLLEKLRAKLVANYDGKADTSGKKGSTFDQGGLKCESQDGNDAWEKVVRDKNAFGSVMMQFFSAVAIGESNWDTYNNLQKGAGANKNAGAKGGVMNLTLAQMDNKKYSPGQCGCTNTNSEQQSASFWLWYMILGEPAYAQAAAEGKLTVAGRSPGVKDSHHSIGCGAHMALVEAAEDGVLFRGEKPKPGSPAPTKPPYEGAAKIYASLQSWGYPDDPQTSSMKPEDQPLDKNPKLNSILKKVNAYCRKNVNANGKMIRTFEEDFPNDGTNLRNNTIK